MCLIANLIVIDQFTKRNPNYMYILTHWHSDHYQGIKNGWSDGPIFTSRVTRSIALTKYPGLGQTISVLSVGEWTVVEFGGKDIGIFAIDANHMAGSIMVVILISGKYYLHTGDMRFNPKIAQNTPQIFNNLKNGQFQCKYKIEQLHLDNTFCDPIFQFPTRSKALRLLIDLIKELKPIKLFICTDSIGKQQAFIILSKYYKVKIAVNSSRMSYIKQMDFEWQKYFTLNLEQTWIESIRKQQKENRLAYCPGSVAVTLTGWANLDHCYPDGYNSYLVPYSLHSNFREMEMLVCWVRPVKLIPIVREGKGWQRFSAKMGTYKSYVFSLCGIKQRGLQFLRNQYCQQKE